MGMDWAQEGPSLAGVLLILAACVYMAGATFVNMVKSKEDEKAGRVYAPPADVTLLDRN